MAPDGDGDVYETMLSAGWSEGLPVVPPTAARVAKMLTGTSRGREEVLGLCPPMYAECTVGHVAANAVMAGCEARHMRGKFAARTQRKNCDYGAVQHVE